MWHIFYSGKYVGKYFIKSATVANFIRDIVVVKEIYGQVAKWHLRSQSRKNIHGERKKKNVYLTDSGGCTVGARLWRSPKSSGLVRGEYLDGWPLSRVLAGAHRTVVRAVELWGLVFVIEISITKIKSHREWPALSAQVFRGFPVPSCECDTVECKKRCKNR